MYKSITSTARLATWQAANRPPEMVHGTPPELLKASTEKKKTNNASQSIITVVVIAVLDQGNRGTTPGRQRSQKRTI